MKNKVLVIDNYDSFTYNLVHLINEVGYDVDVRRNDKFELAEVSQFEKILLSPGPGIPSESGLMPELIKMYAPTKSILGICLGQQAIAESFGGLLFNLSKPMHGLATTIEILDRSETLFSGCPNGFSVGRYHSWVVDRKGFPDNLLITAVDKEGSIMGLRHKELDVKGLQFHPESVLTEYGMQMMKNWLD